MYLLERGEKLMLIPRTIRHKSGAKMESLDPVGQEDGDVDNDGKKDKTDKYMMKRS